MIYSIDDLLRASMIGETVTVRYRGSAGLCQETFKLCGIDAQTVKLQSHMYAPIQTLSLDSIESISRGSLTPSEWDLEAASALKKTIEEFLQQKQRLLRDKRYALSLHRRFPEELNGLCAALEGLDDAEALKAFFASNAALTGNAGLELWPEIEKQLPAACAHLQPEQAAFAQSLFAVARRNLPEAQMAYLMHAHGHKFSPEFIRLYGAKLAVVAMKAYNQKQEKNPINTCSFVFWIDKLLEAAPEQVIHDPALWLNYLNWCVTYQHFTPLCTALRQHADHAAAFDALAYVFALNEQPLLAGAALRYLNGQAGTQHTPGELMVHLVDDELSYYARFADRVERLISDGDLGNPEAAYIYDYVRARKYAHVVNGYLISYFVNQTNIEDSLLTEMSNQLALYWDYDPTPTSLSLSGNVVTSVKKR